MTPDIVLVTVDSLRVDHCSFVGYERETTPALDELASTGTVFENAIAPGPSTPESMPAVFTGQRFQSSRDDSVGSIRSAIRRHLTVRETIPERLSRLGYATAGFTPNPFTSRFFGFDAGFDTFEDFMGSSLRQRYGKLVERFVGRTAIGPVSRLLVNLVFRQEAFKPWEAYYDDLLEWVRGTDRPYFLWVHLMDPHIPYLPPREFRSQPWWSIYYANYRFWRADKGSSFDPAHRERLVRAYDDAVRYADAFIDRLRTDLEDDLVFIVHGDHGEAFGEHGTYGHEPYLHEENIHVPLVIGNGNDETVSHPISLVELPDLLVDVARGHPPVGPEGAFAVSRTDRGDGMALRGAVAKYIVNGERERLFDLRRNETDPIENEALLSICQNRRRLVERAGRETRSIRFAAEEVA